VACALQRHISAALSHSEATVDIATGVDEAAVSPDLARVAFSVHDLGGAEIRGYDVALRARQSANPVIVRLSRFLQCL